MNVFQNGNGHQQLAGMSHGMFGCMKKKSMNSRWQLLASYFSFFANIIIRK